MGKYIIKRLLQLIPVLIGITFLSFAMMRLAGGDAVTYMYENAGSAVCFDDFDIVLDCLSLISGRRFGRLVRPDPKFARGMPAAEAAVSFAKPLLDNFENSIDELREVFIRTIRTVFIFITFVT